MSEVAPRTLSVKLYMKAGCHLCEEVERELESLRPRYPHILERVDITSEAALMQRYGEQIPVLLIHGREYVAPLSRTVIEHALKDERIANPGVRAESSDAPARGAAGGDLGPELR